MILQIQDDDHSDDSSDEYDDERGDDTRPSAATLLQARVVPEDGTLLVRLLVRHLDPKMGACVDPLSIYPIKGSKSFLLAEQTHLSKMLPNRFLYCVLL